MNMHIRKYTRRPCGTDSRRTDEKKPQRGMPKHRARALAVLLICSLICGLFTGCAPLRIVMSEIRENRSRAETETVPSRDIGDETQDDGSAGNPGTDRQDAGGSGSGSSDPGASGSDNSNSGGRHPVVPSRSETQPADESPASGQSDGQSDTQSGSQETSGDPAADGQSGAQAAYQENQAAFDDLCQRFLEDQLAGSYINLHYSMVSPEDYGITDYDIGFGDFSLDGLKQSYIDLMGYQEELNGIDIKYLDEDSRLTYRILKEALRLEESGAGLEIYYQPLAPTTGIQAQLPILLAEFAFRSKQDIDDYLTLLSTIDTYYQQILDFEKEKAAAGIFLTDSCIDQIVEESSAYTTTADENFMTTTFNQQVDVFPGLTAAERADYKRKNLTIVEEHFIPAYQLLLNGLTALKGSASQDQGLCYYPEGRAYYEYLVNSSIGTNYGSIRELRDAITSQIESDLRAISRILTEYPDTMDDYEDYSFAYTDPDEILTHLKDQIAEDFPEMPECSYVTKFVPDELSETLGPAFFLVPPIDDYDDCIIYVNPDITSDSKDLYTTLAHEGIPGHMYQNTYFLSHCSDNLRRILSFTSYSEGWATYVENYAYTTDNGLSPELGQLLAYNSSATLALHALIDININYFGWTREQVKEFMASYFDLGDDEESQNETVETMYNAMLSSPVNYLDYYVGYLEIINMKDLAEETQGDAFRLKDFHTFLLDIGPAPFTVIRSEFEKWLEVGTL